MPDSRAIRTERHERLAQLIRRDAAVVIDQWTRRAAEEQPAARRVHLDALLDHLPAFLAALADSLEEIEDDRAQQHRVPALRHGEQRWETGWSLPELVRDFQLLRTVVLEELDRALDRPLMLREVLALNLAFDEAIAASTGMYVASRDEAVRQAERALVEREKQTEQDWLRQQAEALKEIDRRKDEFLAVLGHELRNPLAPIRNVVQAFKMKEPDAETVQWATGVVERQVRQMTRLVDDLLDITRITRGTVHLRAERVDLSNLVRVAVEDRRGAMEASRLQVELHLPAQPAWVKADPDRIGQVVGNLLHNAGKFTPAGGRVTVTVDPDEKASRAVVAVTDTGVGLDPTELAQLFETFRQSDRSRHRSDGGLGLGLALVKGLVELHGGGVHATSAGPDRGSEFSFWLPLDRPSAPSAYSADGKPNGPKGPQ
jgi:signal transduction histidine kinase